MVPVTNFPTKVTSTCDALLGDRTGLAIVAQCTGTPPTTANVFAVGCLMQQSDGTNVGYENTGTSASPVWTPLTVSGSVGIFIAESSSTSYVRLGGSPTTTVNGILKAVEFISGDNTAATVTFSIGSPNAALVFAKGSAGVVTGCTGASQVFTTSGCITGTVSAGSGVFKAYFSSPTAS